ncbi:MAG: hypothetical protein J6S38_02790, partial [Erysipelotrichaceae bacterium]|nr:hypothetical protein [Erysipelotrichaceae bacterium]
MGWFDEQIKQRKLSDQEVLEDSYMQAAGVILGRRIIDVDKKQSKVAIDDILKYYRIKPTEAKEGIDDFDEALEYILRPHGIMRRNIKLSEGWYQDAYGPILGFLKENQIPVALLPRRIIGYYYTDPESGKRVNINRKTAENIADDALCFYRPLPLKKLEIIDLTNYMRRCISAEDIVLIVISSIIVSLVGLITPRLTKALSGPVLNSGSLSLLVSIGIFIICTTLSSQLFNAANSLISSRISSKISLSVEAAVMARVLSLPAKFFRQYSSGELSSRASSINSLCSMLASFVFSLGLTGLSSLLYVNQIFNFAPSLVIPSIVIIAASILLSVLSSSLQIKISGEQMKLAAKGSGLSFALVTGIQKIKLSGAEKRAFSKWLNHYAKET